MTRTSHAAAALLGASAIALALAGCKIDNRPLLARNGPPPPAAPPLGPLDPAYGPAAPATYLPPSQAYAYPQRAYAVSRVVSRRPPSYAFAYGDEQPWVWDAADEGMMFAEPIDDGYRYYYYEPGEAYPYFVQDADYGYAYGDNGVLLALFDAAGALIARDRYDDYAPQASRYWTRAYDLNRSYWRSPRYRVQETVWRERAPRLVERQDRWFRAVSTQPAWGEALRHDNGRHLGWYKDRNPPEREREARDHADRDDAQQRAWNPPEHGRPQHGRQFAFAGPPQAQPRHQGRADRAPQPEAHGWRQARQDGRPGEGGRGLQQPQLRHQDRPQGGHGPQGRPEGHGGQAFARAADTHGRPAAWRGPDQTPGRGHAQPGKEHPGGGPHGGGGGGGHEKGGEKGGGGDHGKGHGH